MSAGGLALGVATTCAATLALMAVVATRAWSVCPALPWYLAVVVVTNVVALAYPTAWSWDLYYAKEVAIASLKLAMINELAGAIFADELCAARARARRVVVGGLIALLALVIASGLALPSLRTFRALAVVNAGCALLLAGLWLVSILHVVPLHPVARALLHGLSAYSITLTALMGLTEAWPGLAGATGRTSEVVYTAAMLYLAHAAATSRAWRPLRVT